MQCETNLPIYVLNCLTFFLSIYSRLKEYITYISTPSQSPADARLKQQMADKIFELMRQEEVKLVEKRPLSSQLGNFFSFI